MSFKSGVIYSVSTRKFNSKGAMKLFFSDKNISTEVFKKSENQREKLRPQIIRQIYTSIRVLTY